MIGGFRVVPDSGFAVTATLSDSGVWLCDDANLGDWLNLFYSPLRSSSPAYGPWGALQVAMAAKAFKGKGQVEHFVRADPQGVY